MSIPPPHYWPYKNGRPSYGEATQGPPPSYGEATRDLPPSYRETIESFERYQQAVEIFESSWEARRPPPPEPPHPIDGNDIQPIPSAEKIAVQIREIGEALRKFGETLRQFG